MALAFCAFPAAADDEDGENWHFELKRQNTGRGTTEESTKTTLRLERLSKEGFFTQLRLDVPLPDAKTDFAGDPFDPRLGDVKIRASVQPVPLGAIPWTPYLEITFPTAHPQELGSGKYQVGPGMRTYVKGPSATWGGLVQQVWSVAGDPARKDINYTKLELSVRDQFGGYGAKATLKPNIDWVQDGKTGGVFELEGSTEVGRHWRVTLMGGHLVWDSGVQGTYGKRLELTLARDF